MVMEALETIRRESGTTVGIVTHDQHIAEATDRIITLVDGRIVTDVQLNEADALLPDMLK